MPSLLHICEEVRVDEVEGEVTEQRQQLTTKNTSQRSATAHTPAMRLLVSSSDALIQRTHASPLVLRLWPYMPHVYVVFFSAFVRCVSFFFLFFSGSVGSLIRARIAIKVNRCVHFCALISYDVGMYPRILMVSLWRAWCDT